MKCARKNCPCEVEAKDKYEMDGKQYCCEKCAKECTDERCTCKP